MTLILNLKILVNILIQDLEIVSLNFLNQCLKEILFWFLNLQLKKS
jgi:hypothetical protein